MSLTLFKAIPTTFTLCMQYGVGGRAFKLWISSIWGQSEEHDMAAGVTVTVLGKSPPSPAVRRRAAKITPSIPR